jgi:hypothetical protein
LNQPFGLAFDSAGNLYAANYGNNTIQKFTMAGFGSRFANTGLSFPNWIAMRPNLVVPVYLSARQSGSELILSWPTNAAGFKLQSKLNLTLRGRFGARPSALRACGTRVRISECR